MLDDNDLIIPGGTGGNSLEFYYKCVSLIRLCKMF